MRLRNQSLQAIRGPGQLAVRCYRDDGWSVVDVEDSGPEFPPEVLARAFAPFHGTKTDGTGLGLAISKRIVEEHGGTIIAENPPDGGARLRIRLPRRSDAP